VDLVLKLRELRRMAGLSQKEAARRSGVGEKTISSFETGGRIDSLKITQLQSLLKVYGVTPDEFFSDHIEEVIAPWYEESIRKARELARRLETLPESVRVALVDKMSLMVDTAEEVQAIATTARPYAGEHREWQMLNSHN
jgi:transcriptional regulator with XRE-family HTH domain